MTPREEFINSEVATWGYDYIFDLIDRGYLPVETTAGFKWLVVDADEYLTITSDDYATIVG